MAEDNSTEQSNDKNESADNKLWLSLAQRLLVSETLAEENIAEWMNAYEQHEITNGIIAETVDNCEQQPSADENYAHQKKMTHSERPSSIEVTNESTEHQEEVTPTILMTLTMC